VIPQSLKIAGIANSWWDWLDRFRTFCLESGEMLELVNRGLEGVLA
jgi:hypothetical protein